MGQMMKRLIKEAGRYRKLLIIAMFSTLMLTIINLVAPKLMSQMIAVVSEGMDESSLEKILMLALMLLGIYMVKIVFRFLANYMAHKAAWNLVRELYLKIYDYLQNLSIDFFSKHQSGDLVSRTINDANSFELLYAHLIPESLTNLVTLVGVTVILFSINPQLALLTCIPIPFILILGVVFSKKVRPNFRISHKMKGKLSAVIQENYSGVKEIQTFGQQRRAYEKVDENAVVVKDSTLNALKKSAVFHPTVEFLTAIGTVIVVGFGGMLAFRGEMQVSEIVAFFLYLSLFYAPITGIAQLLESLQEALAGAERVFEVLDAPRTVHDKENAVKIKRPSGKITLQNVRFFYEEEKPVLEDVSFEVGAGQMYAIVGATGVGKSTLVQLLTRFYDPVSGEVLLDGQNIKDITLESLRQNIAMVLQDTFLFNSTVADNISFARPNATQADIEAAAKAAFIHEDIMRMPNGYDTLIGERGTKLSGGQKQRIAIARAIICDAPVLIMDEATASVDVQTEAHIQEAIGTLKGQRTMIVIAHRLSTIRKADCILVFDEGRIVQRGTHEELVAQEGMYKEMCKVQQEGASLA